MTFTQSDHKRLIKELAQNPDGESMPYDPELIWTPLDGVETVNGLSIDEQRRAKLFLSLLEHSEQILHPLMSMTGKDGVYRYQDHFLVVNGEWTSDKNAVSVVAKEISARHAKHLLEEKVRELKGVLGVRKASDQTGKHSITPSKQDGQATLIGADADDHDQLVDTTEMYENFADDLAESISNLEKLKAYIGAELP
jgi:hypothetical protein